MVNRRRISVGEFRPESGEAAEILVVSLESAEARRAAFAARAAETPLSWRFFFACTSTGPGHTIVEASICRPTGPRLSKGEIDRSSSHLPYSPATVPRGLGRTLVPRDTTLV